MIPEEAWGSTTLRRVGRRWGARYTRAFAAYSPDWTGLRYSDGRAVEYVTPPPVTMPELGVLRVPDARVLGVDGWAVARRRALIADASFIHESEEFHHFRYLELDEAVRLRGVTLNLASTFSNNNYGHALLDGLGRLSLTHATGLTLSELDQIIVPAFWTSSLDRLLAAAGADPTSAIRVSDHSQFAADMLIQTSFPGAPRAYPRSTAPYLRQLVPSSRSDRRLLAVRRTGRRAVRNVDEVQALAIEFDLEVYDPMLSDFPPADFAATSLFVSGFGADLSDIAFMRAGGHVVELLPDGSRYPYFGTLALSSGLSYTAVDCRSTAQTSVADFDADIDELRRVLEKIG